LFVFPWRVLAWGNLRVGAALLILKAWNAGTILMPRGSNVEFVFVFVFVFVFFSPPILTTVFTNKK
jgi:hypothetical protein